MAQAQPTPRREVTPDEFARQLGATISAATPQPVPPTDGIDPDQFAQQLGGATAQPDRPLVRGTLINPTGWDAFWRSMYASIPDVTGMIGGVVGAGLGATSGALAGGIGAVPGAGVGGVTGAGIGGGVGRAIQFGIDELMDRPEALRNPRGIGDESTRQMTFEGAGRVFSSLVGRFQGRLAPKTQVVADRLATSQQYDIRLSPGEITGSPGIRRVEYLAQRGIGGYARQKAAQARTDAAAQKAVASILDTLGTPGTATGVGIEAQEAVRGAAGRAGQTLEATTAGIAPRTGMGTAGELAEHGVQAGRTAFSRQGEVFNQLVSSAPPVDMEPIQMEAWRIFNDEIMPVLVENPSLMKGAGAEWQKVVRLYRKLSQTGELTEFSPQMIKALGDAALEKAPYAPLRIVNQILATPRQMSFKSAIGLRGTLRDAGKGSDLIASNKAKALATYFEAGSTTSEFRGTRGAMIEAFPQYEELAATFRQSRQLFGSAFIKSIVKSDPEAVISTLIKPEGGYNASRIRRLSQVLQDLPQQHGTPDEVEAGRQAWNTVRAEWFRRAVIQDNVFGLADRMKKIDPDVLAAWFPDLAGRNVVQQATITGRAFESQLLAQIAESDPSKVVDMIGASPSRVNEFVTRIKALPGPVNAAPLIDRVRRQWVEQALVTGDPAKLSERLAKTDPDLVQAWFPAPQAIPANAPPQVAAQMQAENAQRAIQQQALVNLRRLGQALETRRPVEGMGAYESLGAVTVVGNLMMGNFAGALKTAIGFEGIPAFLSWAMYNPKVQQYLFDVSAPNATVTSRTAAMIHMLGAYNAARTQLEMLEGQAALAGVGQ